MAKITASAQIKTSDGRTIDDLLKIVQKNHEDADLTLIRAAYEFAKQAHGQQQRKTGDLYIVHPLSTAMTLAELGIDDQTIAAGLLHDVPEDTDYTLYQIRKKFGKEIALLVEGITKVGQVKYRGVERYVNNLRHMFVAMAKDVRVMFIKFADRIHNLQTLNALPPEKRRRIALESLEIYAPIANRLGMGEIKGMLEDLAFPHVYPEEYNWLIKKIAPELKEKEKFMKSFIKFIQRELKKHGIQIMALHGRMKHHYSLYRKLVRNNRDLSKIHDLVALRVVVKNVAHCYATLGVIHEICRPLKGRIKDYIAQPKPNGYQSLHTTVFSPAKFAKDDVYGEIVEIQIRTPQMHYEDEYGVAAHWKYKEGESRKKTKQDPKLDWMKQIITIQKDVHDEKQLLETLKVDIFQNFIFIFTPLGDVIELPEDATPIDFAYKIHSDLGNKCTGVKINDQIGSLKSKLKSGDVVEIFTDPNRQGPSVDWLLFVKTNTARSHIRTALNKQRKNLLHKYRQTPTTSR